MDKMIVCQNISFRYRNAENKEALADISLEVGKGEILLLCGESGCGKTTLTRLINGLIPHYYDGKLTGSITVGQKSIPDTPLYDLAETVGSVFQNPRSQFFNVDTTSELAFACENIGLPEAEIRNRLDGTVKQLSLENLLGRSIFSLSGGEKQKIACGGVTMLSPACVVLDEPTSNLDISGIEMLRKVLAFWKAEGRTIVIAEHRLWFLKELADRVLYMKDGRICEEYAASDFFTQKPAFFRARGLRSAERCSPVLPDIASGTETFCMENLCFSYRKGRPVLSLPRLTLPLGKAIGITGRNGAGKSTLVQGICGLLRHDRSRMLLHGKSCSARQRIKLCFPVMQDVNHQLFAESVLDEVLLSMEREDEEKALQYLEATDLLSLKDRHPMSLSGGQKQRTAIASALASGRELILFDEPTSGLDLRHMEQVARAVQYLKKQGKTILIVTHDAEFLSACCDWAVTVKNGRICPYDPAVFA